MAEKHDLPTPITKVNMVSEEVLSYDDGYYVCARVTEELEQDAAYDAAELEAAENRIEQLEERIKLLEAVVHVAALCTMDLNANLKSAYEEYMRGEIPHGAYGYVLSRHGAIHTVLHNAGYTEKHKIFEYPVKPEPAATGG